MQKNYRFKDSLFILALGCLLGTIHISAQTPQTSQRESFPILRGVEAIRQLKQSGRYNSLREAVKTAREENSQTVKLLAPQAESAKLIAADGAAGDALGYGVAISGDTAVVGSSFINGGTNGNRSLACVFTRSGTTWTQQAKLMAAGSQANDNFGGSVAISGDTIVIGSNLDDVGTNVDQGSAYVFTRNGTIWRQQQQLTASDGAAMDNFGFSVAITDETIVVGSPGSTPITGSAYIFTRSGTAWTQRAKLTASDGAASNRFGYSVAISGETIVSGALGANGGVGAAYVFTGSGANWAQQTKLVAADSAAGDFFGISAAISGDTIAVGASFKTVGSNDLQGAAYAFTRSGATWTQQAKLTALDGEPFDDFGWSIAISVNTIVVGADFDAVGANDLQGSAYIFRRNGATWTQRAKLTASDGAAEDIFGSAVAISGKDIIVGAPLDDVGTNIDQGSAYIFQTPADRAVWQDYFGTGRTDYVNFDYGGEALRWDILRNPVTNPLETLHIYWGYSETDYQVFGDQQVFGDYDGDSKTDVGVWRAGTDNDPQSYFYIKLSSNPDPNAIYGQPWGLPDDLPLEGDFDGDGIDDFNVVRVEDEGLAWYSLPSGGGHFRRTVFGLADDIPAYTTRDFDGDGRDDLLVIRTDEAGNMTFFVGDAMTGELILAQPWGNANVTGGGAVIPLYGNYVGDSRADVGIYYGACPSDPTCEIGGTFWFKETGSDNYTVTKLGVPYNSETDEGDFPDVGNYDGDEKLDISVADTVATTYTILSSNGQLKVQYWDGFSTISPGSANHSESATKPNGKSVPADALRIPVITKQPDGTFKAERMIDHLREKK